MIQEYSMIYNEKFQPTLKVVKEYNISNTLKGNSIEPRTIASLLINQFHLDREMEEHLYMLMIRGQTIKGISEISHGGWSWCPVDMKSIITRLLLSGADALILAHNHPADSVTPSDEDCRLTERVKESIKMIDCYLLDHIIINSKKNYLSMNEKNYLCIM